MVHLVAPELRRRRVALFLLFGLPGLTISSWVARTPDVRDLLGASTEQLGLVLFGMSLGALLGVLAASLLVHRLGTRTVTTAGSFCTVASMPLIAAGSEAHAAVVVALGLGVLGLGLGSADVGLNLEAAAVERVSGVSVLPPMHGCFSVGTVIGALAGVACTLAAVPVGVHLTGIGAVGLALALSELRHLSPHPRATVDHRTAGPAQSGPPLWLDRRLLLIAVIVVAMGLGEGAAVDWLPLVMVDGHGSSAAAGSTVFVAFATCMAIGRFSGGYLVERFGRTQAVRVTGSAAVLGISGVALAESDLAVVFAVVLWGLGVSLGIPVAMSAAGDASSTASERVSFVASIGYVAFLVGPPSLGFLGEHYGLRSALLAPMALIALAVLLAPALRTPIPAPHPVGEVASSPAPGSH